MIQRKCLPSSELTEPAWSLPPSPTGCELCRRRRLQLRLVRWAQPQWLSYWCHSDTPWLTPRLRQRIRDFSTVLGCRFPTITDVRSPGWSKTALQALASWRYSFRRYSRPWELEMSRKVIRLWDPRLTGL